jgi:putative proteasome-type protease
MLRDNWGKKLREMFDSLEDPVWNGDATDIPLKKVGKHSPLKKIATPEEKLI